MTDFKDYQLAEMWIEGQEEEVLDELYWDMDLIEAVANALRGYSMDPTTFLYGVIGKLHDVLGDYNKD